MTSTNKKLELSFDYVGFLTKSKASSVLASFELEKLACMNLGFANELDVYQLRDKLKKIKIELTISSAAGIQRVILYQNCYQKIKNSVEDVAKLFQSFWNRAVDENPNIKQMMLVLSAIVDKVSGIENRWEEMNNIDSCNVKAIRFYSYFAHHILNDYDLSYSLYDSIAKMKGKTSILGALKKSLKLHKPSQYAKRDVPCLFISTQLSRVGYITDCNMSAIRMFGVDKKKLIEKHMNSILPSIYLSGHELAIREFIETNKKINDKEIKGYIKHVTGFLIPITKRFAEVPSIMNGSNFIITLEENKKSNKYHAYMLIDAEFKIVGLSSSCSTILKINPANIQSCPSIYQFCPALAELNGGKDMCNCIFFTPGKESNSINVKIRISPLLLCKSLIGYSLTFEKEEHSIRVIDPSKKLAPPKFQFYFDESSNQYVRDYAEDEPNGNSFMADSVISSYSSHQRLKSVKDFKKDSTIKSDKSKKALTKDEECSKLSELSNRKSSFLNDLIPRIKQIEKSIDEAPKKNDPIKIEIIQIVVNSYQRKCLPVNSTQRESKHSESMKRNLYSHRLKMKHQSKTKVMLFIRRTAN